MNDFEMSVVLSAYSPRAMTFRCCGDADRLCAACIRHLLPFTGYRFKVNSFAGHLAVRVHRKEGLARQTYVASFRYRQCSSWKPIDVGGAQESLEGAPMLHVFTQGIHH
jgi:hypothetical protein